MPLLEREDCLLIAVDLQPAFWGGALDEDDAARVADVIDRAVWLAAAAAALDVPVVATEEDPSRKGPAAAGLTEVAGRSRVFTKPVFDLARCPDILEAVAATGRRTAVLCGFETDVCVTHSAVGLLDAGFRVAVVEDAVYSPAGAQQYGLSRLRDLGIPLLHCKGVYFDWVRTLEAALGFQRDHPRLAEPPGFWI